MDRAFISMGSNMGDRMDNLATAIDKISDLDGMHVEAVSHAYESKIFNPPTTTS